ncbi:crossover junction endodeoxyribonuclease RuvC [Paenibacillus abyssi]|uniref:Holliday junction nuclease RuvC n=1 Tax=Paenibacillus abyssi TaxID=1340531 RepID=A0A917CHT9_9BACL|nr:crossover junction endodeoxyribonuclease RuvC [Paenibacillus abyssi]GGF88225.1 hypothetical protein GCM10010916_01910 [Paenibacillus abyssi]
MTTAAKKRNDTARYLGLDLSLSPGLAVIDVKNRIPTLVYAGSVATSTDDNDAVRSSVVESFVASNIYAYRPFDLVLREDFIAGRNKRATQTIFNAWTAADRALHTYGYTVADVKPPLSPTSVKKIITGNGRAEKPEVAEAVRKLLRLPAEYKFAAGYDDSDAAAVVLAWLIRENLIDTKE